MNDKSIKLPDAPKPWKCPYCKAAGHDTILGYHQGDIVRVKYKELYIEIEAEGRIARMCMRCGARVEVFSQNYELFKEFREKRLQLAAKKEGEKT